MKKLFLLLLFLFPVFAHAEEGVYPWILNLYGGGASLCDEDGCFGPTGYALGASFGRAMSDRWSFELEGTYAYAEQTGVARVDLATGLIFAPVLQHTRIWGGGHFLVKLASMGKQNDFFLSLGLIGGYEQQVEVVPEGIFPTPTRDIGIRGGAAGGAGMNFWFADHWGFRPEVRFYAVGGGLSGVRYTAGLLHKF